MEEMSEREEFVMEVCRIYDEYLMRTENRGMSYGELAYVQNLDRKELEALYEELLEEDYGE